jgi:hypothetical protein
MPVVFQVGCIPECARLEIVRPTSLVTVAQLRDRRAHVIGSMVLWHAATVAQRVLDAFRLRLTRLTETHRRRLHM